MHGNVVSGVESHLEPNLIEGVVGQRRQTDNRRQTTRHSLLSMFRYGVASSTRICLLFPLLLRFLEFSPAITQRDGAVQNKKFRL